MDEIINLYERGEITQKEMMHRLVALGIMIHGEMTEEKLHEWLTACLHGRIANAWSEALDFIIVNIHQLLPRKINMKTMPLANLIDALTGPAEAEELTEGMMYI